MASSGLVGWLLFHFCEVSGMLTCRHHSYINFIVIVLSTLSYMSVMVSIITYFVLLIVTSVVSNSMAK